MLLRVLLACLGVLLTVWSLSANAQAGPPPAHVAVERVQDRTMTSTILAPGTVVSRRDAAVAAETSGRLTWVAEIGAQVAAGDVIASVDDQQLRLRLRNDEATIRRLQASLKYANRQLDREQQLARQDIAARNQLEESESVRDMSEQELIQARVAREQTELLIEKSRVRAPFDGRIVARFREAGEFLSVGGEVVRLVDTGNLEVRAQVPINVARFLREGAPVTIRDQDREAPSTVRTVIPVGDQRSRMIEVRVALDEPGWVIGAAVRVALPETDPATVMAVHRDALILRQNAIYLFRVKDDDTVEQVAVTTGVGDGEMIEVRGDVQAGDRVVIRGGERLQPGQKVLVAGDDNATVNDSVKLARTG
jgi:RND family efflux transporter MFP subunit